MCWPYRVADSITRVSHSSAHMQTTHRWIATRVGNAKGIHSITVQQRRGFKVLLVSTGEEIARQIASVARKVYHSARVFPGGDYYEPRPNLERVAMLSRLPPDGTAVLADERVLSDLDSIVYCTGDAHVLSF
jgi:hypothetical protein